MARERGENGIKQIENGKWQIRITYTDSIGKRRTFKRQVETISEAKRLRKQFLAELDSTGEKILDGERLTFEKLSAVFRERKVFPARYVSGRKIAGLRSHTSVSANLNTLNANFGAKRVKTITPSDVEIFKASRLATPVIREINLKKVTSDEKGKRKITVEKAEQKTERTIASVNREIETLRTVLRFAVREGWLSRSPFDVATNLVSKADENRRDRTLSHEEEKRLLDALSIPRRIHLFPIVMTALDTAMRRGELFKLRWSDVDLASGLIFIRATNTKTQTERIVGMTPRVESALRELREKAPDNQNGLIFGITDTIKTGWRSACRDAGIVNLRFHDLRHTAITRMVNENLPASEIMKTSGHTQVTTFQRYVNPTAETARRNAGRLSRYNDERMRELEAVHLEKDYLN